MVPAAEAFRVGIVNRICSPEDLMETVATVAKSIAKKGKVSLRAAKQAINGGMNVDLFTGCNIEVDAFAVCMAGDDATEGTTAFLEKRKPDFRGSLKG